MSAPVLDWVRAHPVLAGALACALVGTANAEYTLATGTHVNEYVALAVPGALDLYVIQALRVHRDVAAAVLVMVAANVASHLLTAGLYPVGYWWDFGITAGVGALAPGIVWRVHALERTRNRKELLWGLPAGAVKTPEEPSAPAPVLDSDQACEECRCILGHAPGCTLDPHPKTHPSLPEYTAPVHPAWASAVETDVPDSVPEEWSAAEYGDPDAPVPYLRVLPDPEPEYTVHSPTCPEECECPSAAEYAAGAVHLNVGDDEYIDVAKKYVADAEKPSVRGLRRYATVGQARAERLLAYLGVRP